MPDNQTADGKTNAESKANRDEIRDADATRDAPRGNRHSEADPPVEQDLPPPLPH